MICQPWLVVYQQFRRWDEAGCFEAMVNDMRSIIRVSEGRRGQPVSSPVKQTADSQSLRRLW